MAGVGLTGPVPVRWSRRGLLALLLVGALLLCHGAYGALHQLHQTSGTTLLPAAEPSSSSSHTHTHGAEDGEHPGAAGEGCIGCVPYAATLLVFFLGTAAVWFLSASRGWSRGMAALPSSGRLFSPGELHPARGPTLPALQVFRL
jgi:hypothetical protein